MNRNALTGALLGLAACAHEAPMPAQTPPAQQQVSAPSLTSADIPATYQPQAAEPIVPMNRWTSRFPDAAMLLGAWVEAHPAMADALATWQRAHTDRMETLIDWSVTDTSDPIGSFLLTRWGWDDLRSIASRDPAGFDGFLHWVRSAPDAAVQIGRQGEALRFAVQHAHDMASVNPADLAAQKPESWTLTGRQTVPAP